MRSIVFVGLMLFLYPKSAWVADCSCYNTPDNGICTTSIHLGNACGAFDNGSGCTWGLCDAPGPQCVPAGGGSGGYCTR